MHDTKELEYQFLPAERPTLPGAAAVPAHPVSRKTGYGLIGVLVGVTATFGNALVTVNVPSLAGSFGGYVTELSWLPAVYIAVSVCANLLLVKARIQFGLANVTRWLLLTYAFCAALQFFAADFAAAAILRGISGAVAALLTALTLYNLMQIFPARLRPRALVAGMGFQQLGTPLARLVPVDMLAQNHWQSLHFLEIAGALAVLAAVSTLPLPQAERSRVFEPLDFLTMALLLPAMVLICGVLNEGRLYWWFDAPWIGYALAVSIPFIAFVLLIERARANPLLQIGWMGSVEFIRFACIAGLVRLALAEQTYGAVGLLTSGGLDNDQLHGLFFIVTLAMLLGTGFATFTVTQPRLRYLIISAALCIALGSWLESYATHLTRPPQLYLSEALIAFGTTLFIGPALVIGFARMMTHGPSHLITFLILFNITQNVGGLAGAAFLGTFQEARTAEHAETLSERVRASDPQTVSRIEASSSEVSSVVIDSSRRNAEGDAILARSIRSEAVILAYNDVSQLVAVLAVLAAGYLVCLDIYEAIQRRYFAMRAPS